MFAKASVGIFNIFKCQHLFLEVKVTRQSLFRRVILTRRDESRQPNGLAEKKQSLRRFPRDKQFSRCMLIVDLNIL